MVHLFRALMRIRGDELGKHFKRQFIDKLRVFVKSGKGGRGIAKLGGIGGKGGNVICVAKENLTLKDVYSSNLKKRYVASHGEDSRKLKLFGQAGQDVIFEVPCGLTIHREDTKQYLGELNQQDEQLTIAYGGDGGSKMNKYEGQEGEIFTAILDLKLIADVGLIGFPNAGKSSFLSLISRAQPKIANYPFTTLVPQLGQLEFEDKRVISIADLPGLIEGAHFNRGKGIQFLKHVSRTKIHVFIVDINGFCLNDKYEAHTPFQTLVYLNKELEMFDSSLVSKPSILVLNKIDTDESNAKIKQFYDEYNNYEKTIEKIDQYWIPKERVKFDKIFEVSMKMNINIDKLCLSLRELLDEATLKKNDIKYSQYDNKVDLT